MKRSRLLAMWPGLGRPPRGDARLCWPVTANAALARILRSLFATTGDANKAAIDALGSSFQTHFGRQVPRPTLYRSAERGRDVARLIADWSRGDGGDEGYLHNFAPGYIPPTGPSLWVPTPPGFQPPCNRPGAPTAAWQSRMARRAHRATRLSSLRIPTRRSSPMQPRCTRRSTISRRSKSRSPGFGPRTPQ